LRLGGQRASAFNQQLAISNSQSALMVWLCP
jgi:hypothetical protein